VTNRSVSKNPYQTPACDRPSLPGNRIWTENHLVDVIESRLLGTIDGGTFHSWLDGFEENGETKVAFCASILTDETDLFLDPVERLKKTEWNLVQRVLLCLKSDTEIVDFSDRDRFCFFRLCYLFLFSLALLALVIFKFSLVFLLLNTILGATALVVSSFKRRRVTKKRNLSLWLAQTYPLASLSDLENAVQQTGFQKKKFPFGKTDIQIHSSGFAGRLVDLCLTGILCMVLIQISIFIALIFSSERLDLVVVKKEVGLTD